MNNEFPKNWYIILTAESREAVKKWWESTFPTDERLFGIGSAYGVINNQQIARVPEFIHDLFGLGGKEITFEQFKKYILEEETEMYTIKELSMSDKKIIGYKLVKPEYEESAYQIAKKNSSTFDKKQLNNLCVLKNNISIPNLQKAGVLNLWFEPVYQAKYELPILFGHKGVSKKDNIEYGCQIINKKYIQQLYSALAQRDFTNPKFDGINSIQVGIHGIVKLSELKQIVDFIDNE